MQRFYFKIDLGNEVTIDDKDFFHQVSHVLRSRLDDEIVLFNWDWIEYQYEISGITKKWIDLKFVGKYQNEADIWLGLNLYQALPNKYEKIELIIQKWTEIGISRFVFFNSERSQKLVINDKKIERFNFIIKEALEQCGWNRMPELIFIDDLDISMIDWKKIVCHTDPVGNEYFRSDTAKDEIINLFVWPEGWFSDKEIWEFKKNGYKMVNFWNRVFRTETTGILAGFYLINTK